MEGILLRRRVVRECWTSCSSSLPAPPLHPSTVEHERAVTGANWNWEAAGNPPCNMRLCCQRCELNERCPRLPSSGGRAPPPPRPAFAWRGGRLTFQGIGPGPKDKALTRAESYAPASMQLPQPAPPAPAPAPAPLFLSFRRGCLGGGLKAGGVLHGRVRRYHRCGSDQSMLGRFGVLEEARRAGASHSCIKAPPESLVLFTQAPPLDSFLPSTFFLLPIFP